MDGRLRCVRNFFELTGQGKCALERLDRRPAFVVFDGAGNANEHPRQRIGISAPFGPQRRFGGRGHAGVVVAEVAENDALRARGERHCGGIAELLRDRVRNTGEIICGIVPSLIHEFDGAATGLFHESGRVCRLLFHQLAIDRSPFRDPPSQAIVLQYETGARGLHPLDRVRPRRAERQRLRGRHQAVGHTVDDERLEAHASLFLPRPMLSDKIVRGRTSRPQFRRGAKIAAGVSHEELANHGCGIARSLSRSRKREREREYGENEGVTAWQRSHGRGSVSRLRHRHAAALRGLRPACHCARRVRRAGDGRRDEATVRVRFRVDLVPSRCGTLPAAMADWGWSRTSRDR
jgi:hypothetical protein